MKQPQSAARFRLRAPKVKLCENDIEHPCIQLLRMRGYFVIRTQSGLFKTPDGRWTRIGEPGMPDYAVLHAQHPGFLLEVKRPGGTLSEVQKKKVWEIQMVYRLEIVVADRVEVLIEFLKRRETGANSAPFAPLRAHDAPLLRNRGKTAPLSSPRMHQ